jgi:ELWxxDGT repeat protein
MPGKLAVFVEDTFADGINTTGLCFTDGTAEGTYVLPLGFPWGYPHNLVVLGGDVLFAFGVQSQTPHFQTLWISDGTPQGTHEITGIANVSTNYGLDPESITVVGSQAFFIGIDADDNNGLWVTDGTAAGTKEIVAGVSGSDLTAFNGKALFNNGGLWVTDGTASGTFELMAVPPDLGGGYIHSLTVFNNQALFAQALNYDNNRLSGLWVTDGTAGGTHEITGIVGASPSGITPAALTVFAGGVIFSGIDAEQKRGIWITDGTSSGTHEITGVAGAPPGGLAPSNFVSFKDKVLFAAQDANNQIGLWVTDGTAAGTHELVDIIGAWTSSTGPRGIIGGGLNPFHLLALDDKVLFNGTDSDGNIGLWVTDGTAAGTHEVTGIADNIFVANQTTDPIATVAIRKPPACRDSGPGFGPEGSDAFCRQDPRGTRE